METVDLSVWRFLLPPVNREGLRFVFIASLLTLGGTLLWAPLFLPLLALTYGVYLFFRDPERAGLSDKRAVLSPADGIVCMVSKVAVPAELEYGSEEPVWRVCVFMSVLDVHVNRMPIAGRILRRHYVPGKFLNASLDKASEANERMLYLVEGSEGQRVAFVQIAGLVARRIVSFAGEGATLERGERFGLIRFGSRVDVYLPPGVEPEVRLGQTMVAGETPIARV